MQEITILHVKKRLIKLDNILSFLNRKTTYCCLLYSTGKLVLCLFFSAIFISLFGQQGSITWGKLEGRSGHLIEMLPFHSKDFYTLRWKGGNMLGGYFLSRFDDLVERESKRISISVNQNIANFESALIVDDHPVIILTNIRDGQESIFLQQYGYDLTPRGAAKLLAQYDLQKGMSKSPIKVIQSKDKSHFAVLWLLVSKRKNNHDVYGYAVYDKKYNQIDQGEYEVPFESNYSQITNHLLSNTGHYFFIIKEFQENTNRKGDQPDLIYNAMHIYQVSNDIGLKRYTMPLEGKRIEAISVNTDDSLVYTITGVYGNNTNTGINGVFYMQVDFQNQHIVREGFQEFSAGFITEDFLKREQDRTNKRIEKGDEKPALYNYRMREAQLLSDGSIVGVMEQSYIVIRSFSDTRSVVTFNYTYYYNDIIVFKIGQSGDFSWLEKIKKSQVSINDGGPYSSFASIVDGDKLRIIFNDHVNNYDQKGQYISDKIYPARFNLKHNVVVMTELDLNDGTQKRYTLFSPKETKTLAFPKKFKIDVQTREMLIYTALKGKELYGVLTFQD